MDYFADCTHLFILDHFNWKVICDLSNNVKFSFKGKIRNELGHGKKGPLRVYMDRGDSYQ